MPQRKRNHQVCLRLTDEENALWEQKCIESGMNKTDFLAAILKNSNVRIYSIEDSIKPLIHEIRKIGTNLNQIAYFSNIGQNEKVMREISSVRKANNLVMEQISEFLKNPEYTVK